MTGPACLNLVFRPRQKLLHLKADSKGFDPLRPSSAIEGSDWLSAVPPTQYILPTFLQSCSHTGKNTVNTYQIAVLMLGMRFPSRDLYLPSHRLQGCLRKWHLSDPLSPVPCNMEISKMESRCNFLLKIHI